MMESVQQIKRVYFVTTALRWLAVGFVLPISVLFMQSRGINLVQLGIIMGVYSVTVVLLELPTGGLADAIGRKRVALMAQACDILAGVLLFFSFSFWGFLAGMILLGVARALNSGALDAWYVDCLQAADPQIDLQPALAQAGTVTLLALGVGTLAGGALPTLFSQLPADGTALISPLSTTLLASLAVRLVLFAIVAQAVHEPPRAENSWRAWRSGFQSVPEIVGDAITLTRQNRNLPLLMGATLIGGFAFSAVETFWQPNFAGLLGRATEQSWLFGLVMAISFLAGMAGNMVSIPASKRLGQRYALLAGLARASQGIALLGMALLQSALGFAAFFWIFYLGTALNSSPHDTLVNNEIPAERRSAMLSAQSLAIFAGSFLGSIVSGAIAENYAISSAWILAALVSMVSLILYARVAQQKSPAIVSHDENEPILDGR